jgi:hypothetical protein
MIWFLLGAWLLCSASFVLGALWASDRIHTEVRR